MIPKLLLVLFVVLSACSIADAPQEEVVEQEVDWSNWSESDGVVVFVSDETIGAMTFIMLGGAVDFDIGEGVTVTTLQITPQGALLRINEHERVMPLGHTETVDGVSVRVEEIIIR